MVKVDRSPETDSGTESVGDKGLDVLPPSLQKEFPDDTPKLLCQHPVTTQSGSVSIHGLVMGVRGEVEVRRCP